MKILDGIRVVEFATHVVIPAAARVMADWGADVIKVEASGGDQWRVLGRSYDLPVQDDCNPMYSVINSGKRFVSLDLKKPEGKAVLMRMLESADVFVTNIRWAAIERLGLDYDTLHAKFPRLVYMHFNGFGYEGDDKDRPGLDSSAFWAMSGAMHEFHEPGNRPAPMMPPAFGDTAASGPVLSGVLGGLLWRDRTGEGIRVTSSLLANGIWCNHNRIVGCQERADGSPAPQFPRRAEDAASPFSHIYECSDGEWIATVGSAWFRKNPANVLRAFGLEEYIQDERYNTYPLTRENSRAVYHMCVASFKTKSVAEWHEILDKADIPHQKLEHSCEVSKSEQAWANGYLTRMECPNGQSYVVPNSPVSFFGFEKSNTTHAGAVGSNTTEVLLEYGYTIEEIQNLRENNAVFGV